MQELDLTKSLKIGNVRIMERDFEMLEMLLQYRVLLPEQLANFYGVTTQVIWLRMNKLCKIDLVKKVQLKRYRVKQNRQGVMYFITTNGIRLLQSNPFSRAKFGEKLNEMSRVNIRLEENHIPYVLNANDLGLHLTQYQWAYLDSREAKGKYQLNRQLLLHGMMIDANDKEMWYYGYQENLLEKTFKMLANELESVQIIQNVLITHKGESASEKLHELLYPVKFADRKIYPTSSVTSLKVMDFDFAKLYFSVFNTDKDVFDFMNVIYSNWIKIIGEHHRKSVPFVTTVAKLVQPDNASSEQKEQHVFIANLLDVDLVKIVEIRRYNQDMREREGMNLILVVRNEDKELIKSYFAEKAYKHIGYFVVNSEYIESYRDNLNLE